MSLSRQPNANSLFKTHPHYADTHYQFENFTHVPLSSTLLHPSRILALDMDEVILRFSVSCKEKKPLLIHMAMLKYLLKLARQNNVMVVIVTARKFLKQKRCMVSIPCVFAQLGKEYFSHIFYTNHNGKQYALEYLHQKYFKRTWCQLWGNFRYKICLVDDYMQENIVPCAKKGFDTIFKNKTAEDLTYLNEIEQFILGQRSVIVPEYEKIRFEDTYLNFSP